MDLDRVERIVKLFHGSRVQELTVEAEGWQVALQRGRPPAVPAAPVAPSASLPLGIEPASDPLAPELATVTAPLVGIFRQSNGRIAVGQVLRPGDPIGGIESMKIFSPLVSEVGGRVMEVFIEDGHPVEYGQPLLTVAREAVEADEEEMA